MWFTRVSLQNPVFATMVMLALVVLGLFSLQRLQVDQFPNIDFPVVVVIAEQTKVKLTSSPSKRAASRFVKAGLLLCFAFIITISGQINSHLSEIEQAQLEFDNGNYDGFEDNVNVF